MNKYIFLCQLYPEYQKKNDPYSTKMIIVARSKNEAVEKLKNYNVSHGRIHYYSSKITCIKLNDNTEIEQAEREQKESVSKLLNINNSLGLAIALLGANLGKAQVSKYNVKIDCRPFKILTNSTIKLIKGCEKYE